MGLNLLGIEKGWLAVVKVGAISNPSGVFHFGYEVSGTSTIILQSKFQAV